MNSKNAKLKRIDNKLYNTKENDDNTIDLYISPELASALNLDYNSTVRILNDKIKGNDVILIECEENQ
ncbi:MAG: hypothetical protein ACW99A_16730 [Candidatus Kariarchaeaceae archaeon]|jgi:hypothetical protein